MNVDHFYTKGHGHSVCQDFAASRIVGDYGFAVVSDGCSSSERSEIGATLAPNLFISSYLHSRSLELETDDNTVRDIILREQLKDRYTSIYKSLGLPPNIFDATILALVAEQHTNRLRVYVWGDGNLVLETSEGFVEWQFSYPSNAPFYLSYALEPDREVQYLKSLGDGKVHVERNNSGIKQPLDQFTVLSWPLDIIKTASILSDGIETFSDAGEQRIKDSLQLMTHFKSKVGEFVQRRAQRLLKDYLKQGINHFDDVSCASINMV